MKKLEHLSVFPREFLWGAATASHQVEGGNYNQWSEWETSNAHKLAKGAHKKYHLFGSWERVKDAANDPSNYISGAASRHYDQYEKDFDFLSDMNMNSYRFSIEWARVEPQEGEWDKEAIAHYRTMLRALKRRHIEPVVTLFHFTLPIWFAQKGGFEKRSNTMYFVRYVQKIMTELGNDMKFIITINEPTVYASISYLAGMWPPARKNPLMAWRVLGNLADAHTKAANCIHGRDTRYQVSIAHQSLHIIADDKSPITSSFIKIAQQMMDYRVLDRVVPTCDFIGINYYMSHHIKGLLPVPVKGTVSDLDWSFAPADIQFVLERIHAKYHMPIMITENGIADATDALRERWISETIFAMERAVKNGVLLKGYLHWSLMDNFEWAFGKWPRFGLVAVDYNSGTKKLRTSARWFGEKIASLRSNTK